MEKNCYICGRELYPGEGEPCDICWLAMPLTEPELEAHRTYRYRVEQVERLNDNFPAAWLM